MAKIASYRNILAVCVLLYLVVTSLILYRNLPFDFDELYAQSFISNDWKELLNLTIYDPGNPPVYFWWLKLWASIVPVSEVGLRIPSVAMGMGTILGIYAIGKHRLKMNKLSLAVVLLMVATSEILVFYGTYARPYSLLLLLSVLVVYFNLKKPVEGKINWGVVLSGIMMVYVHYAGVVFLFFWTISLVIAAFLSSIKDGIRTMRSVMANNFLIFIGYCPWIYTFASYQFSPEQIERKYWFWQTKELGKSLKMSPGEWLASLTNNSAAYIPDPIAVVVYLAIGIWLLRLIVKGKLDFEARTLVIFVGVYLVALLGLGLNRVLVYERYSIFIFLMAWLGIAMAISAVIRNKRLNLFIGIVIGLLWLNGVVGDAVAKKASNRFLREMGQVISGNYVIFEDCQLMEGMRYYADYAKGSSCELVNEKIEGQKEGRLLIIENSFTTKFDFKTVENFALKNGFYLSKQELLGGYNLWSLDLARK